MPAGLAVRVVVPPVGTVVLPEMLAVIEEAVTVTGAELTVPQLAEVASTE